MPLCSTPFRARFAPAVALLGLLAACGGGSTTTEPQSTPAPVVSEPIDPATAGSITGTVTLVGKAPAPTAIKTRSDPNCHEPLVTETYVVGGKGELANVFVYVKDGLGNRVFPVPTTPVVLAQKDCTYAPHVFGVQVGQSIDIVSEDETLHNVHAVPVVNQEFNVGQPGAGVHNQHVFSAEEVLVPFKCDVHNWMNAYAGVVNHPFFAVSAKDGTFSLDGLPPGTYTIEAIHEKLGKQTQTVTLGAKDTQSLAFSFTFQAG